MCQLGAHLILLQSYAWTNMALDHWKSAALKTALSETFDGRHPCGVCLKVQNDASSKKKQEARAPERGPDFSTAAPVAHAASLAPIWTLAPFVETPLHASRSIDLPPPRSLQA